AGRRRRSLPIRGKSARRRGRAHVRVPRRGRVVMAMSEASFRPEDLPILGEPLAIELANSLYETPEQVIDFLESPADTLLCVRHVDVRSTVHLPNRLGESGQHRIVELRAVVRELLERAAAGRPLRPASIDALNAAAAIAPSYASLDIGSDGVPRV